MSLRADRLFPSSTTSSWLNYSNQSQIPSISTEGLILHLDASNHLSYPGSGNTWYDLSSNQNNATLNNGVSYDSNNSGSLLFDGTNDYIEITNNNAYRFSNTQAFSINLWIKCTSSSGVVGLLAFANNVRGYYFSFDINATRTNSFYFDYWDGGAFRGIQGNNNSLTRNAWVMLTATSASNSVNDMKVYQNTTLTSYTNRGTGAPNSIDYNSVPMRIGARGDGAYFSGNIGQVSVYNKSLTTVEILQNFNAVRGRYGI